MSNQPFRKTQTQLTTVPSGQPDIQKENRRKPLFFYSPDFLNYHFHDRHPFNQQRLQMTIDLLKAFGYLPEEQIITPHTAATDELALIHEQAYMDAVRKASDDGLPDTTHTTHTTYARFGLGTEDTPVFKGMHDAAALIVGGTLSAAKAIMEDRTNQALNLAGGLHHAFRGKASGFCVYNDCAVAIAYLRKHYDLNILYIDTDAHHGDGVQWAFYDDPRVFTLSIHETGRYLFPGSGHLSERGFEKGYGYALNLPVDAFTQDDSWLSCFSDGLLEVADFFKPDLIISQHGVDAHFYDPLTHLCNSMRIYQEMPQLIKRVAEQYAEGRWLAVGGGGYDIVRVVPRAWSLLWMVMNDLPVQQRTLPASYRTLWQPHFESAVPTHLLDEETDCPSIPRQSEIEASNERMKNKALQFLREQMM
jgi:acetoin utilization protein AcuC